MVELLTYSFVNADLHTTFLSSEGSSCPSRLLPGSMLRAANGLVMSMRSHLL